MNDTVRNEDGGQPEYQEAAGARMDALRSRLREFSPEDPENIAAIRREARLIREAAVHWHLPAMAAVAQSALGCATDELRFVATNLLALLRDHARSHGAHRSVPEADLDRETGLLNRSGFAHWIEHAVRVERAPAAIAKIHVGTYETVRERHGEAVASMLLAHVGGVFSSQLRQGDCLAHGVGDEFLLLLPGEGSGGLFATLARLELCLLRRPFPLPSGAGQETVRMSSGGYRFLEGAGANGGMPHEAAPLRIGVAVQSQDTREALRLALESHACEVIEPARAPLARYEPFAHQKVRLVVFACDRRGLPCEFHLLRETLSHDRTPILALVADERAGAWVREHGACEVLIQPVGTDAILKVVRRLAGREAARTRPATPPVAPPAGAGGGRDLPVAAGHVCCAP